VARYTDAELKVKAEDVLCAYNLGDPRAEMMIGLLSSMTGNHPQYIFQELNRMADKEV
jgi:hypothetical protein